MAASEQTAQDVPIRGGREILDRLEAYLSRRDGVDKLLKIARYASKIIIASSVVSESQPLNRRLRSFESSVGVTRKALRLGKFLQDFNALRGLELKTKKDYMASIAYTGEGLYYFAEQFVWLSKAGLIDARFSSRFSKIGAWCEFVGYVGSISVKFMDLAEIGEKREILTSEGHECVRELRELEEKELMKKLSIVQDWADWLMAFADIRDGKGLLTNPLLLSSAGLLSALISTHKIWVSCRV